MAVNKNFVVKNGLEVNTDLILADVDTNRVGIGTSIADYTLHVNGGIGATDLNITGVATVTSLTVSNDATFVDLDATNINVTGVGTIVNGAITNITGTAATISSVQIASGIVTATSGLVTYYGDGQYLRNIQSGVGIRTAGAVVGYGATFLDFRGAGVSTVTAPVSGISTLFITGGGGGSISISTTPPAGPSPGNLWYSPDHARTFIYYDESEVGYGTGAQWIDASPFNVGVLTGHSLSVADLSVTNTTNIAGILTVGSIDISTINASGIATASIVNATDSVRVASAVTANSSGILVAGIVTATSFKGDGSDLTNLPAGLGTALSSDNASPLNKIYYTDQVLAIGSTVTVDPPSSAQIAYTQYAQIQLNDSADLIVAAGDDFIPDILGIGTTGVGSGTLTGDGGRIRADNLTNRAGTGAPTANNGLVVSGACTATTFVGNLTGNVIGNVTGVSTGLTGTPDIAIRNLTGVAATFTGNLTGVTANFSGNVTIGGTLTYDDVTNVDSIGVVTARGGVKTNVSPAITIRDGTTEKGYIGFNGNDPFIGRKSGVGVAFQNNKIRPVDGDDGSASNNTVDIGESTYKFKDGYFAGTVTAGGLDLTGQLIEQVNITAGKLSDNTNINIDNGMLHHFTTAETTTATPNITSTAGLNTSMAVGDAISVTLVTTAAAAGYASTVHIDGSIISTNSGTLNWTGGTAPSAGGSSGVDIYAYTIMKTASGKYTVIASLTKTSA